jgi:thiamine biosynthesis lipoprotein
VEVWTGSEASVTATRAWFEAVEDECSRFRPMSRLSQVNRSTMPAVEVGGILGDVLAEAEQLRLISDGLVDVGIGAAVSAWGYDRPYSLGLTRAEAPRALPTPAWRLDGQRLYRDPGTLIDLGGVAKGWACDRAVEDGLALVVSAGGDMRSAHPDTTVPIVDPWGEVATRIRLGVGALATSSVTRRRWKAGDREVSHIIDPRTMAPVDSPVLSATVVTSGAARAEAGAKVVLLRGEAGLAWADQADWVGSALAIWHDGSVFATGGIEAA